MSVIALEDGWWCDECGVSVLEKVVVPGEVAALVEDGSVRTVASSEVGPNLPCGHRAAAVWTEP